MPKGNELAEFAQEKVKINKNVLEKKFNNHLKQLIDIEFEIYQDWEDKCSIEIIKEAIRKNLIKDAGNFENTLIKNYELIREFYLSISQSRKSRAGKSFENHVKYLFNLLDYPFETQTQLNGIIDYLIPGEEAYRKNRTSCVVISIKRTLRERWRQTVGELSSTNAGRIYLLTADTKISIGKVDEMKKNNVNLVVWDKDKKSKFSDRYNVLGYTQFISVDLPSTSKLWESLV